MSSGRNQTKQACDSLSCHSETHPRFNRKNITKLGPTPSVSPLSKTGSGTLILTGDLAHTGGTTINGGILQIGQSSSGGSISGAIANNSILSFDGSSATSVAGEISGAGSIRLLGTGPVTFSGTNTYTGGLVVYPGATLRLANNSAASNRSISVENATIDYADGLAITNTILGEGNLRLNVDSGTATQAGISEIATSTLEKTGAGTLVLTNSNSLNGGVSLSGGILSFGASNGSLGIPLNGTLTFNGGTLRYTRTAATYTNSRATVITTNHGTLEVADAESTFTLAGALAGTGTLHKAGAGTVNLTGTHTAYTGAVAVDQGRLQLPAATTSWAANAFSVASGSELSLASRSSGSYDLGSLSGAGNVTLAANAGVDTKLTVGSDNTDTTFSGTLSASGAGTGSLTKLGSGTLTLAGINTYTGRTTLRGGALRIASDTALGDTAADLALDGGTLQTTADFTSARAITLAVGGGAFATDAGTSATFSGIISGTGSLTKTGAGTLILANTHIYTGDTTISAGTLALAGSAAFSSFSIGSAASLIGNGTVGSLTVAGTLAPGNSPGLITVDGDLQIIGTSVTTMELGGLARGINYDAINVTGSLSFGGRLTVSLINDFAPSLGDSFQLFSFTSFGGSFAQVNLPTISPGLAWNTDRLYDEGTVSVSAIPEPSAFAALAGLATLALATTRRRRL